MRQWEKVIRDFLKVCGSRAEITIGRLAPGRGKINIQLPEWSYKQNLDTEMKKEQEAENQS